MKKTARFSQAAIGAGLMLSCWGAAPAHAEFFNNVKRSFQTEIPHFFQDDIPCAFGGQPMSGAKSACRPRPADPAVARLHGDTGTGGPTQPLPQPVMPQGVAGSGGTQASPIPAQRRPIPY